MNREAIKQVLLLYRPGTADARDPEIQEALEAARKDPELGKWLEQHLAFQAAVRGKFRDIRVAEDLKARLLESRKVVRPAAWWQQPAWLAAAAAVALLLAVGVFWPRPGPPDRFANYRDRMVSTVLREYRMDLETPDMARLRDYLAGQGGPADYRLTRGLEKLQLTGGGSLRWRSQPVSMVCFDRGDKQMLFLFVMARSAVKDPPPGQPQLAKVRTLATASWTEGDRTYVLAGPEEADFTSKYF